MVKTFKYNHNEQLKKYETISKSHGGYFRDSFVDHSYLYNLYFPPEAIFTSLRKSVKDLTINYPVGQNELSRLISKIIFQPAERIIVGNGASEIIKILASMANKLIVPVPSFNEYINAAPIGKVVEFPLEFPSFQLNVDKFADKAKKVGADMAVVISPNNPTSLSVPKKDLIHLSKKLKDINCLLIVDESFIDFARDSEAQSLEKEIEGYHNLAIIKSMSKSYGVCGLRLGYLLTCNHKLGDKVRKKLHIWNVNGFAEEFLRQVPNYTREFVSSCEKVKRNRDVFYKNLSNINGIVVYKPDANFVFCRLPETAISGPRMAKRLFMEYNMYIKDCQEKNLPNADRYIRIASRTPKENSMLVKNLTNILLDTCSIQEFP